MARATMQDLMERAVNAITKREEFVQDVADNIGQMVDNVGHTENFRTQVMFRLITDYQKYAHLREALEKNWSQ